MWRWFNNIRNINYIDVFPQQQQRQPVTNTTRWPLFHRVIVIGRHRRRWLLLFSCVHIVCLKRFQIFYLFICIFHVVVNLVNKFCFHCHFATLRQIPNIVLSWIYTSMSDFFYWHGKHTHTHTHIAYRVFNGMMIHKIFHPVYSQLPSRWSWRGESRKKKQYQNHIVHHFHRLLTM